MNQSSDAALIKLLHDSLYAWLKFAKHFNEIYTQLDQLEESLKACKSLAWIHYVRLEHSEGIMNYTLDSLNRKHKDLVIKEFKLKQEFGVFSESFERKFSPFLAAARVYGQSLKNVLPGSSCDSFSNLILLASALCEALNEQSFFFNSSDVRHEAVKFVDKELANDIQQIYTRFRSA